MDNSIRLFKSDSTDFSGNSLGILSDILTCSIDQELNSSYEMTFTYPINGVLADQIDVDMIVVAPSINQDQEPQAFRIYAQTKPINGIITYKCQHISYDMADIPVLPFSVPVPRDSTDATKPAREYLTLEECINQEIDGKRYGLNAAAYVDAGSPFKNGISVIDSTEESNKEKTTEPFKIEKPASLRSMIGGSGTTISGLFSKAEFVFDNFKTVIYAKGINRDNGFGIVYGKNLVDFSQEKKISSMYTHIYPYWVNNQTSENGNSTSGLDRYRTSILWTSGKTLSEQKNSASISARTSLVSSLPLIGSTNKTYLLQEKVGGIIKKFSYNASNKKYEEIQGTSESTKETPPISGEPNSNDFVDLGENPLVAIPNISGISRSSLMPKILLVDLTSACGEVATNTTTAEIQSALLAAANKYIEDNIETLSKPEISLKVTYAQLSKTQSAEYMQEYDRVRVGDIVHVYFPQLGTDTSSKCTKVSYDVLANRIASIELGTAQKTLTTTLANQTIKAAETPTLAETKQEITNNVVPAFMATKRLIDSNRGGFVQFHNSASTSANPDENQATPDEILILDAESNGNLEKAKGVWRWNSAGLGFFKGSESKPVYVYQEINTKVKNDAGEEVDGKVGQWVFDEETSVGVALTANGEINASRILTGELNADLIKVGTISGVEANFGEGRLGVSKDSSGNWSVTLGDVWAIEKRGDDSGDAGYSFLRNKTVPGYVDATTDSFQQEMSFNSRGFYLADVVNNHSGNWNLTDNYGAFMSVRAWNGFAYTDGSTFRLRYAKACSTSTGAIYSIGDFTFGTARWISSANEADELSRGILTNRFDMSFYGSLFNPSEGEYGMGIHVSAVNTYDIQHSTEGSNGSALPDGAKLHFPRSIIANGPQVFYYTDENNASNNGYHIRGNYAGIWFDYQNTGSYHAILKGSWASDSSINIVSDRRAKKNVSYIAEKYDTVFDKLRPVTYSYKDFSKMHIGFIAQEVEEAVVQSGLSDVLYSKPEREGDMYALYYDDFIALNTYEIQKLKKRVAELETLIANKL